MGLDMYLRASEYVSRKNYFTDVNGDYQSEDVPLFTEIVNTFGVAEHLDPDGFSGISIDFPMGYWRKANQIHAWFVNNVQNGEDNCGSYYVSREHLMELKDLCLQVLANNSLAEELLPPQMGFFFGGYDVDEWYLQQLQNTIEIIDRCLASKFDYFEYQSSW